MQLHSSSTNRQSLPGTLYPVRSLLHGVGKGRKQERGGEEGRGAVKAGEKGGRGGLLRE